MSAPLARPVEQLTAVVASLRPEWQPLGIEQILRHDTRPWSQVVTAAVLVAMNPEIHHPLAIRSHSGDVSGTPAPPAVAEVVDLDARRQAVTPDRAMHYATSIREFLREKQAKAAEQPGGEG